MSRCRNALAACQKVTLDENTQNPMELDHGPGDAEPGERPPRPQLAPDFAFSQWVYMFYSLLPDSTGTQVVARFKMNGDTLDLSSEQRILTFQHQTAPCCHSSGSLYFGPDGSLYISTGDNTNPYDSSGYNPIDERSGREYWDAQRTAANTNDLNGKILRIKPMDIPLGAPGVGTTRPTPTRTRR